MATDIRRLARLRLKRPDVGRAVSMPSVLQLLLRRWRAELSCAVVLGDTEVHMAALGVAGPQWEARDYAPPRLYEMQSASYGAV